LYHILSSTLHSKHDTNKNTTSCFCPKSRSYKELKELEKQGQDVDVVLLQEELLGEEQQEKLLAEEEQQEDDADLFLFFLIYI